MIQLAAPLILSCADAQWIIDGMYISKGLTTQERNELIEVVVESAYDDCDLDTSGESTSRRNGFKKTLFWRKP